MKTGIAKFKHTAVFIAVMLLSSSFSAPQKAGDTQMVIIVHANNPIEKMTNTIVRAFWLRSGKKRWPQSSKAIKPVDRKTKCVEKDTFLSKVVEMKADDVEAYFSAKQYQYAEAPPDKFATDSEIIDFVAREEGAIAYVSKASISGSNAGKVKIVFEF